MDEQRLGREGTTVPTSSSLTEVNDARRTRLLDLSDSLEAGDEFVEPDGVISATVLRTRGELGNVSGFVVFGGCGDDTSEGRDADRFVVLV